MATLNEETRVQIDTSPRGSVKELSSLFVKDVADPLPSPGGVSSLSPVSTSPSYMKSSRTSSLSSPPRSPAARSPTGGGGGGFAQPKAGSPAGSSPRPSPPSSRLSSLSRTQAEELKMTAAAASGVAPSRSHVAGDLSLKFEEAASSDGTEQQLLIRSVSVIERELEQTNYQMALLKAKYNDKCAALRQMEMDRDAAAAGACGCKSHSRRSTAEKELAQAKAELVLLRKRFAEMKEQVEAKRTREDTEKLRDRLPSPRVHGLPTDGKGWRGEGGEELVRLRKEVTSLREQLRGTIKGKREAEAENQRLIHKVDTEKMKKNFHKAKHRAEQLELELENKQHLLSDYKLGFWRNAESSASDSTTADLQESSGDISNTEANAVVENAADSTDIRSLEDELAELEEKLEAAKKEEQVEYEALEHVLSEETETPQTVIDKASSEVSSLAANADGRRSRGICEGEEEVAGGAGMLEDAEAVSAEEVGGGDELLVSAGREEVEGLEQRVIELEREKIAMEEERDAVVTALATALGESSDLQAALEDSLSSAAVTKKEAEEMMTKVRTQEVEIGRLGLALEAAAAARNMAVEELTLAKKQLKELADSLQELYSQVSAKRKLVKETRVEQKSGQC